MDYDIHFCEPVTGKPIRFEVMRSHRCSSTEESDTELPVLESAHLAVSYEYAKLFLEVIDSDAGIRWLFGRTGEECAPRLVGALVRLQGRPARNSGVPDLRFAERVLYRALAYAQLRPDGVFRGNTCDEF